MLVDPLQLELASDEVVALPQLKFGGGAPSGSDKAGGFLSPDLPIRGLSRRSGTVGDIVGMAKQQFKPEEFLKGALPKLFGIVDLVDLVEAVTGEPLKAPTVVSEALDRVEGLLADLERAKTTAQNAVDEANKLVARAASKTAALQTEAQAALADAQAVETKVTKAVDDFVALLGTLHDEEKAAVTAASTAAARRPSERGRRARAGWPEAAAADPQRARHADQGAERRSWPPPT